MVVKEIIRYVIAAAFILAGIVLIICGMNPFRAVYLIIFGVFCIPAIFFDSRNQETPKGIRFWCKKLWSNTLHVFATLSICNFLISVSTDGFKDLVIWLSVCLICGVLFGSFDYFAHTSDCTEEELEAKRKRIQENGEIYDKVVEEMNSEK